MNCVTCGYRMIPVCKGSSGLYCPNCCPKPTSHDPKPPASEGVREVLDSMLKEFRSGWNWDQIVPDNDQGDQTLKRLTRLFREANEALAALPELEKRLCWRLRIDGESKHPKDCYECNGHGEVWVRKAGV